MAKWAHSDVLDNGLNFILANADKLHVVSTYTAGDSHAVVISNSVAVFDLVGGDVVLGNGTSNSRQLTITPSTDTVSATADSGASPDLHLAIIDSINSKVLIVTDETSDAPISPGQPVRLPAFTYRSDQPV